MRKNIFIVLIIIFSFAIQSNGQSISGIVKDIKTEELIPFSAIAIEGTTIGTITDYDGKFDIEIPENQKNGTIIISCLGYKQKKISVKKHLNKKIHIIKLASEMNKIEEVLVEQKSLIAYTIIKKASSKISENYISTPYNYDIYYSCKQKKSGNKELKREAIVKLFDKKGYFRSNSYNTFKEIKYDFEKSKRNFEIRNLSDGNTNIDELLKYDIARNTQNILDAERVNDFEINIEKETVYKKDSVWIIKYKCLKPALLNTGDYYTDSYEGEIIINRENYAILYNETKVKSRKHSVLGSNIYIKKDNKSVNKTVNYSFKCEYVKNENKYSLSKIELNSDFKTSDKNKSTKSVSVNSSINILKVRINNLEKITARNYFENLVYDADFWRNNKF